MKNMFLLSLALIACACGGGKEPEKYTPDQSTFENAVETYARAMEDGNEDYAADIFPADEQATHIIGLRKDIEAVKERGRRYKILTATAEPLTVQGIESAYAVRLTRVEIDESDTEVGEPVKTWTVFIKEADGKWRLSVKLSSQFRRQRDAEEAAQKAGNALPGNGPVYNTPAGNTPAGNGG